MTIQHLHLQFQHLLNELEPTKEQAKLLNKFSKKLDDLLVSTHKNRTLVEFRFETAKNKREALDWLGEGKLKTYALTHTKRGFTLYVDDPTSKLVKTICNMFEGKRRINESPVPYTPLPKGSLNDLVLLLDTGKPKNSHYDHAYLAYKNMVKEWKNSGEFDIMIVKKLIKHSVYPSGKLEVIAKIVEYLYEQD